jgi:hypothetical protein
MKAELMVGVMVAMTVEMMASWKVVSLVDYLVDY